MKKSVFSKKEIKALAKRLSFLLEKGLDKRSLEVRLLVQRIKFLISQVGFKKRQLRRIFGTAAVVLGLGLIQNVNAQAAFTAPVSNPFGLTSAYYFASPVKADLDNDGDLDILVAEYYGTFQYYQNTGTATAPAFAAPVQNPFGLSAVLSYLPGLTMADLDNDGDLDLMCYEYNTSTYAADIKYFENTGTAAVPSFAAPVTNPFGINSATYFKAPTLIDLDNDGDFDLLTMEYNYGLSLTEYKYQENIGTVTTPNFGLAQTNPFGLAMPTNIQAGIIDYGDIDGDGDLDILFGEFYGYGNFHYYENTGSLTTPTFAAPVQNPFGLVATSSTTPYGKLNLPVLLDLDGDGDLDVLTGEYGGVLSYFENVFTNSGPLTIFNISIGSPSCSPGADGTVTALAGGGIAPITYKIGTDSNTTGNFINLSPGTYTLRIRDSVNTIIDSAITIAIPTSPVFDSLSSFISNVSCNGSADGLIALAVNGGTQPYVYSLLPGFGTPSTNSFFTGLGANTYTAIIADANNCTDTASITITQPLPVIFNIDSSVNNTCFGGTNGAIYTSATGGNGGFTYTISPAVGTQTTPGDFTNLPSGTYTITCSDFNQCTSTVNFTITEPTQLAFMPSNAINVSCFGGNDGSFTASVSGGTPPYTYSPTPTTLPGSYSNLTAAAYPVTAIDANGCSISTTQNITQPPQVVVNIISTQNASSATANDGTIVSTASGGTPGFTYTISPTAGVQAPPGTFTGLGTNSYTITATDANNCTNTSTVSLGFNWPVAVNNIEKHNVKIYPNPVSDLIKLESDIEITSLTVLDVTGKIISKIQNPAETVSMRNLPTGVYVLKLVLKNEETVYTRITKQ